jgi:hypothetical protein
MVKSDKNMGSMTQTTGICHIIIESFAPVVKIPIHQVDLTFRSVYMYKIATKLLVCSKRIM